jgi:hypothetical protein
MPHVDELLGPATFAAAGLVAAIALQPPAPAVPAVPSPAAVIAQHGAAVVRLPTVEVVARRTDALAATVPADPRARTPG